MEDNRQYVDIVETPNQVSPISKDRFDSHYASEIEYPCYLFLDQASHTGYSIFDNKSRLVCYGLVSRDDSKESMQVFANELNNLIVVLCKEYQISTVYFEEVYNSANMKTTEALFYLKNKVQELPVVHPDLGYNNSPLEVSGIDASAWKSILSKGTKFPKEREAQKKATIKLVNEVFPLLNFKTNDESDSLGIGISIMLKGDRNHVWRMTRYNKKLPMEHVITTDQWDEEHAEDLVAKMRKPYREAYKAGGFYPLELDSRHKLETTVKQYLSHKDVLLAVHIPKDYKYWGYMLLIDNINPMDLKSDDGSYYYIACRKKRL